MEMGEAMTTEGYTITELAEELEVTKRTIRYHLQQIGGGQNKNQSGMIIVTPEEKKALILRIKGEEIQETITHEIDQKNERIKKLHEAVNYLNKLLEEEKNQRKLQDGLLQRHQDIIEEKDKQLLSLSEQVNFMKEQLTTQSQLLDQEQQLHLHTKQELDAVKQNRLELESKMEATQQKRSWLARLFNSH